MAGAGDWGLGIGVGGATLWQNLCPADKRLYSLSEGEVSWFGGPVNPYLRKEVAAFGNTVSPSTQADAQSAFTSLALKAISLVVSMLSKRMR